ncbi:hypothetical protein CEXT_695801 [Caerostris extrusa]|uniref:Uncharacterized protein n=1 Tax=Caerostris extrusa TaxID=172846 RepID=A0AAV4ULB9_CAEEX|nr:hypothetical protein CEXT_695801 [Caerostris extrusa]
MTTDLIIGTETENEKDPITNAPAHQNPTSRNKSTTSQQKRKMNPTRRAFTKSPSTSPSSHQKDTSVSNPSISFPTNPQPTDFPEDPAPPAPLARRPWIPPFFVLAKND